MVNCMPKVMGFAVDFCEHLIQTPLPMLKTIELPNPVFPDFVRKQWAGSVPPIPDCFVAGVGSPLMLKVFILSKESEKRTYNITANRMTSGDVSKWRKKFFITKCCESRHIDSSQFPMTTPIKSLA